MLTISIRGDYGAVDGDEARELIKELHERVNPEISALRDEFVNALEFAQHALDAWRSGVKQEAPRPQQIAPKPKPRFRASGPAQQPTFEAIDPDPAGIVSAPLSEALNVARKH